MMPAVVKGVLYLVGLYGFGSLAYEAGRKKAAREGGLAVEGVSSKCEPYLTLPTGHPGMVRIVKPSDPDWCVALGFHLQLAAHARSRALASYGPLFTL
jgi:hypothetical protein